MLNKGRSGGKGTLMGEFLWMPLSPQRALKALAVPLLLAGLLVPGAATAGGRASMGPDGEPGPGYFKTPNVEFVRNLPEETDTAGARIKGHYFYLTTSRGLSIYDISEPLDPQKVGSLPLPQEPQFSEEDPDTNGRLMLVGATGTLNVIDVRDKTAPKIIGTLDGADNHTITCILDCSYAYGSEGDIVDLRHPRHPKLVGDWTKGMPAHSSHDVTEIAPGRIVTSSQPILYLDARRHPAKPKVLAVGSNRDGRFIHGNVWPHRGSDRFLLVGGETQGPCDQAGSGAFMVWDASRWRETHTFRMVDEFRMHNGSPSEGDAPVNSFCAHWFSTNPTYDDGGLVAMGWYEHGTRFLTVSRRGHIKEVGWFLPAGASTSAAYWITKRIVYTTDYQRGFDILRYTGPLS
jgi:hypothetical protein